MAVTVSVLLWAIKSLCKKVECAMGKILCFISDDFADFEITLALHNIRNVGKKKCYP